jgi:hypothetical protein
MTSPIQNRILLTLAITATAFGCTSSSKSSRDALIEETSRSLAAIPVSIPFEATDFGHQLAKLKLGTYSANLHAHHFMDAHGSKKNPLTLAEALKPGRCVAEHATFPMDDGRPCRDENGEENITIPPRTRLEDGSPDPTDYFRQACEYATTKGELDILFITPHSKNNGENEGQIVTSSNAEGFKQRQDMLASINPDRLSTPKFLCGLGQEASSISTGNHINIFGQFHAGKKGETPFFFPTGDFKNLYTAIQAKNRTGGKVFLQFNHPDVKRDMYWGDLSTFSGNKRRKKESLNDYGLDDFGPVGCLTGRLAPEAPECSGVAAEKITPELVRETFAAIRKASGDPFRLIETISPGASKEEEDGEIVEGGYTATTNTQETFRAVHHRDSPDTYDEGIYDWVFYLSMGFKLGPTANQDNHHMNWGSATASRTGVIAPNLKESSILDALSMRHVFASEDKNTRILLSQPKRKNSPIMGDTVRIRQKRTNIQISYYDPDSKESNAKVRLYYYRANDSLFGSRMTSKAVYRTVSFGPKNQITLPASDATDRSPNDLIPIRSGEVITLTLPLERGSQWVFAEVIQDGDFDKTWSAPLWFDRR